MFRSPINCLFFFLILLIFTSTSVFSDCYNQRTCSYDRSTWCCDFADTCGNYDGSCDNSSILSTTLIAVIIIGSIFFFIICLTCCIQSHQRQQQQRMHTAYMNSNGLVVTNPYQQQIPQGPVRIVHARPFYNVGSASPYQQYPSLYEEPPPSYESVAANLPPVHNPAPPKPTVQ